MADLQTCLLGHWTHSHEEDTQAVRVYRPADYNFPPSRGRMGMEFQAGGKLIYYGIARGDGAAEANGRWSLEAPDRVRIVVDSDRVQPFVLQVVSCDEQQLKVKA